MTAPLNVRIDPELGDDIVITLKNEALWSNLVGCWMLSHECILNLQVGTEAIEVSVKANLKASGGRINLFTSSEIRQDPLRAGESVKVRFVKDTTNHWSRWTLIPRAIDSGWL